MARISTDFQVFSVKICGIRGKNKKTPESSKSEVAVQHLPESATNCTNLHEKRKKFVNIRVIRGKKEIEPGVSKAIPEQLQSEKISGNLRVSAFYCWVGWAVT